jgi:hypothetical protein
LIEGKSVGKKWVNEERTKYLKVSKWVSKKAIKIESSYNQAKKVSKQGKVRK